MADTICNFGAAITPSVATNIVNVSGGAGLIRGFLFLRPSSTYSPYPSAGRLRVIVDGSVVLDKNNDIQTEWISVDPYGHTAIWLDYSWTTSFVLEYTLNGNSIYVSVVYTLRT